MFYKVYFWRLHDLSFLHDNSELKTERKKGMRQNKELQGCVELCQVSSRVKYTKIIGDLLVKVQKKEMMITLSERSIFVNFAIK